MDHFIIQRLSFRTDFFLEDSFNSKHAVKYFEIYPIFGSWNYTILISFLNQLSNFEKNTNLPHKNGKFGSRFSFIHIDDPEQEIIIYISDAINVKVTRQFIVTYFKPTRLWFFF